MKKFVDAYGIVKVDALTASIVCSAEKERSFRQILSINISF